MSSNHVKAITDQARYCVVNVTIAACHIDVDDSMCAVGLAGDRQLRQVLRSMRCDRTDLVRQPS